MPKISKLVNLANLAIFENGKHKHRNTGWIAQKSETGLSDERHDTERLRYRDTLGRRGGQVTRVNIEIPEDLHKKIRLEALKSDKTLKKYVIDVLSKKTRGEGVE